jgi:hypothetical protein
MGRNMNSESKYRELQGQYGETLGSLISEGKVENADRLRAQLSELQQELTEFCLANGIDLKSLERDIADIEFGVALAASAG